MLTNYSPFKDCADARVYLSIYVHFDEISFPYYVANFVSKNVYVVNSVM